jgi:general secretion pathway protein A
MVTETRHDDRETSSSTPFVLFSPEETTLAALPFFSTEPSDRSNIYHLDYETKLAHHDVNATLRWRVSADPVYGYPDPFDRKVFKTIEYLAIQQTGLPLQNPVRISLEQILDLVGLAPFPAHLARLRASIRRIAAVTVRSDLTFLTGQRTGRSTQTFHVYDRVLFREATRDSTSEVLQNQITFGAWYLENINRRYLRPIDLPFFRGLRNPIASRLYELLTVKFETVLERELAGWQVSYPVLCGLLPIRQAFHGRQRQLEASHEELVSSGFVAEVSWEKIDRTWMLLYTPGHRAKALQQKQMPDLDSRPKHLPPPTTINISEDNSEGISKESPQDPPRASTFNPTETKDKSRKQPLDLEQSDQEVLLYWKLTERPFDTTPNPKFYYNSGQHQEAYFKMQHAVATQSGAMLLTGEIGSGKTLLTRAFIHGLNSDRYDVALLTNPRWDGVALLREILFQFGQDVDTSDKTEILHKIEDIWFNTYTDGRHTVLIIDEAQLIENYETFEELRLLLNFQLDDRYLITLILVGQPELNAQIDAIPQFEQRLAYRHHVCPLTELETREYIRHRLEIAGTTDNLFLRESASRICQLTQGIPRRINRLCNMCLLTGWMRKAQSIDETIVEHAASPHGSS